jgi:hypothetical protein
VLPETRKKETRRKIKVLSLAADTVYGGTPGDPRFEIDFARVVHRE